MNGRITRPRAVDQDLAGIARYIAQHDGGAAERFLDAAEDAFQRLAAMPMLGGRWESLHPSLADIRAWSIRGFEKYVILYQALPDGIVVLYVTYGGRDIDKLLRRRLGP